ncbi:MAG: POTRA domain-containing protein [Bacteroidales bacterium]
MNKKTVLLRSVFLIFITCSPGIDLNAQKLRSSHNQVKNQAGKKLFVAEIIVEGNQKTSEKLILRELKLKENEYIDSSELNELLTESKKNLLRQPLFNYVTIETSQEEVDIIKLKVIVEERWYLWPQVYIINHDRNFNNWIQTMDFSKLDYRFAIKKYNAFGLNHTITLGLSDGYTKEISLFYQNIYLDKKQLHFIGFGSRFLYQQSVYYKTFQNKPENYTSTDKYAIYSNQFTVIYDYRPKFNFRHSFYLSYNEVNISDSLFKLNPIYLGSGNKTERYLETRYQFLLDKRDSRSYPLTGYFIDFNLIKTGIGSIGNSAINLFSGSVTMKQYYNIADKFYGAHSFSVKKSFAREQPYYFTKGIGYKDFIRGFEYYLIDCEDYYLVKNTMKFELVPKTIKTLNFIPSTKFNKIHYSFYLTTFFDLCYTMDSRYDVVLENTLSNKILFSGGIGLDLATYYDKVVRFDFSVNSLGEPGFFLHFKSSI